MRNKGKKPKRSSSRGKGNRTKTNEGRSATTLADPGPAGTDTPVAVPGEKLQSRAGEPGPSTSLGVLSADASVRSALIASGYSDITRVAATPRLTFVAALRGKLGQ